MLKREKTTLTLIDNNQYILNQQTFSYIKYTFPLF